MKKINTHTEIHAYKKVKNQRKEMVALGHHSGFGLYQDRVPSTVLFI